MLLQVGVKAFLRNDDGKFLLLKRVRSQFKGIDGTWDIVGGRIETGSSLVNNLKREVKEETGLEISSEPKLITAQDILWHENDTHVVRLTYMADVKGNLVLDMKENVEYVWLSLEEMRERNDLDSYVREILENRLLNQP